MKKWIAFAALAAFICVTCVLLQRRSGTAADDLHRRTKAVMPNAESEKGSSSLASNQRQLDSPCSPSEIVITNGVLTHDMRERLAVGSEEWDRYRLHERREASEHGAEAKLTLHVVDEVGDDVTNAEVSVNFSAYNGKTVSGRTDTKGLLTAQGLLSNEITYSVKKERYYETYSRFRFDEFGIRCLENGHWIPWNPTFLITLKDIRHPIPMYARRINISLPKKTETYGFDFLVGDLVHPHGKGERADILISCFGSKPPPLSRNYNETLILTAGEQGGGFIRLQKEPWSSLPSIHEAPQAGYEKSLTFNTDSQTGRQPHRNCVGEGEYLIVRSRVLENENAGGMTACFSKIYGPITFGITTDDCEGAGVSFAYYFNPTPNDRNIEYAPRRNLFKGLTSMEEVYTP